MAVRTIGRLQQLRKVKYGASDMFVTELCAGSMTWGSFNGDKQEAFDQLDCLVSKHGVNFIDTAEMYPVAFNYGKTCEAWIGDWLEARVASGAVKREDLYFATKVNPNGVGGTVGPPWEKHGFPADRVRASCEASLKRLKCGAIDLYMLHFPSRMGGEAFGWGNWRDAARYEHAKTSAGGLEEFEAQVLAVKALLDDGLIKHWGLSNETAFGVTMFCTTCDRLGVPRPVSLQNDFSFNNRVYEGDVAEACHHFGVVGMPYGALCGGALTGKYENPAKYAGDRPIELARHNARPGFQTRYLSPIGLDAAKEYVALAETWGLTPTEMALAWCRDRSYNAVVVTGTTTVGQCEEAVAAFKLEPLPGELNDAIDAIHEKYRSPNVALASKKLVLEAPWRKADSCAVS